MTLETTSQQAQAITSALPSMTPQGTPASSSAGTQNTAAAPTATPSVVPEEEKPIPYARFKEVLEKSKAYEAQLKALSDAEAKEKAEAEKARLAALPEQERLKEQATLATKLQGENTSLQAQVQSLQGIVDSYLKAELESVGAEHRRVIEGMASDPAGQLKALALLRQNGLLGKPAASVPTHNGKPGPSGNAKPGTREEARAGMLRALAGKK